VENHLNVASVLVASGATVNVRDQDWWTPLHAACSAGNWRVANMLLTNGADVTAVNADGDLPIDLCADAKCEGVLQVGGARECFPCHPAHACSFPCSWQLRLRHANLVTAWRRPVPSFKWPRPTLAECMRDPRTDDPMLPHPSPPQHTHTCIHYIHTHTCIHCIPPGGLPFGSLAHLRPPDAAAGDGADGADRRAGRRRARRHRGADAEGHAGAAVASATRASRCACLPTSMRCAVCVHACA